jgi:hypothetical protein
VAAILAIEQTQHGLPTSPDRPGRFAQSTRRSVIVQPPEPHLLAGCVDRVRIGNAGRASRPPVGHQETAGHPAVSSPWSDPCGPDYFQR